LLIFFTWFDIFAELRCSVSESQRPIKYLALPPLSGDVVFRDEPQYTENPHVAPFVAMLGGHARSFEVLREYLKAHKGRNFRDFNTHLLDSRAFHTTFDIPIPLSLITDCLLARPVDYLSKPRGSEHPYSYFVSRVRCHGASFASHIYSCA
jgi:hypothetical protein